MSRFDSIGFDLDGTLWDFTPKVCQAWEPVLRQEPDSIPTPPLATIRRCAGLTPEEYLAEFFPTVPDAARRQFLYRRCMDSVYATIAKEGGVLYAGVREMLSVLSQRYRLFLVSNCEAQYLKNFLSFYGLHPYFSDAVCFGDTQLGKADNIRLSMERCGFLHPVYLGDTESDYGAVTKARIPFIHAAYGFGEVPEAIRHIKTPMDLPGLMAQLENPVEPV